MGPYQACPYRACSGTLRTTVQRPAPTPDAAGGAKAMREAADAAIADLAAWLDRLPRPAP